MELLQSQQKNASRKTSNSQENFEKILTEVKNSPNPKVKVAVSDIDGILRGKYIHKDKFLSAVKGGFGFCNVVFGWDMGDQTYDQCSYTGWNTGFPDDEAKLDLGTFRKVPWDNDVCFFLGDFDNEICPRTLLRNVKQEALNLDLAPSFGQEFEWFNFKEDPAELTQRGFQSPEHLTRGMFGYSILRMSQNHEFFNDLYDLLARFNIPLEGLHTESGPGVTEAAILFGDVLESADRAILFKTAVKEIGYRHGILPTFIAKFSENLPGSSGHIHQSLWRKGENLFYDKNSESGMSKMMKSYMAGLLHCMPHLLPLYAPTVNSYKRLVRGKWAPTTLTWGIDNRTTCIRALPGSAKSTRLELRVVGSDANPYLAHAAALASGLYGIKNNLELTIPMTQGNGYIDERNGHLPENLWEATRKMEESTLARELLGETFVDHFTATRKWEWGLFEKAVTDWELKRYFESI